MSVIKLQNAQHTNFFPSAKVSAFGQSSFDPYGLSSDDDEYLTRECVPEMPPGRSDHVARLVTATRLYLSSPPESPKNWGQVNPNVNDYHSYPMEISSTMWLPDIAAWWHQQEEMHSKYADLSNVIRNIFSIIRHDVRQEASFSLGPDGIGWRQSITTGETLKEKVVVRQFAPANNGILAGDCAALDTRETESDLELKQGAEERKLHRMAQVHDHSEMWQGCQNLHATPKESCAQNKQITVVGYISGIEEIIKASWSNFQHDGAAAFTKSERSPLPPAQYAKDHPGGRTQVSNVRRSRRMHFWKQKLA